MNQAINHNLKLELLGGVDRCDFYVCALRNFSKINKNNMKIYEKTNDKLWNENKAIGKRANI